MLVTFREGGGGEGEKEGEGGGWEGEMSVHIWLKISPDRQWLDLWCVMSHVHSLY